MRKFAAVMGLLAVTLAAATARAETYACHIGKPSYCLKYGEGRCALLNRTGDVAGDCAKWTRACLACHGEIPVCLGHRRPSSESALCKSCNTMWLRCMDRIDAAYWPNRMGGAR